MSFHLSTRSSNHTAASSLQGGRDPSVAASSAQPSLRPSSHASVGGSALSLQSLGQTRAASANGSGTVPYRASVPSLATQKTASSASAGAWRASLKAASSAPAGTGGTQLASSNGRWASIPQDSEKGTSPGSDGASLGIRTAGSANTVAYYPENWGERGTDSEARFRYDPEEDKIYDTYKTYKDGRMEVVSKSEASFRGRDYTWSGGGIPLSDAEYRYRKNHPITNEEIETFRIEVAKRNNPDITDEELEKVIDQASISRARAILNYEGRRGF